MQLSHWRRAALSTTTHHYYSKPIGEIIRQFRLKYHCYADDSQLYLIIKHINNLSSIISNIQQCVRAIQNWMRKNLLKLNEEKTEVIFFSPKNKQHLVKDISLTFGNSTVKPSQKVKNLGCWWTNDMSMDIHTS